MDILHGLHQIAALIYETLASLYYALLLIGAIGIAAQGALGFMHSGDDGGGAHDGGGAGHDAGGLHAGDVALGNHHTPFVHHAQNAPDAPAAPNADAPGEHTAAHPLAPGPKAAPGAKSGAKPSPEKGLSPLWAWLSPMTIFSVCLGTGAAGLLLVAQLGKPLTALVAVGCGMGFYTLVTKPLMRVILGFASRPASNLAGAVAQNAIAMSRFDAQGRGMVTVTVDGELKRLLAYLDTQDVQNAVPVVPGDHLMVVSIDPQKNTCAVVKV